MKKKTKPGKLLLTALVLFLIFSLPSALFQLSFLQFLVLKPVYDVIVGILCLLMAFLLLKNRIAGILVALSIVLFTSFILFLMKDIKNQDREEVNWTAATDRFTMDFMVGKQGYIYLKAQVNDTTGLFLFDTGNELTTVNESFVADPAMKLHKKTIRDASGINQTKTIYKVKLFNLGAIAAKRLHVYPEDTLAWTHPKGHHYKRDSIFGVLGNNIITRFIWDFDLVNRKLTVSKNKKYARSLPDSLAEDLLAVNNHREIEVLINGEAKLFTFDTGCSDPLVISDTLANEQTKGEESKLTQHSTTAFSHLDTVGRAQRPIVFANIKVGPYHYEQIKCVENDHADLFGVPFLWEFERVVMDFINNKAYFISKADTTYNYSLKFYRRQNYWPSRGVVERESLPKGRSVTISKDSIKKRYVFYGKTKFYVNNSQIDSIQSADSTLLPGGEIRHGKYTLNMRKK